MQWARLTGGEYEAMTCAVIATLIGVPQGFVEACLDVACGRVEDILDADLITERRKGDRVSWDVVRRKLEND